MHGARAARHRGGFVGRASRLVSHALAHAGRFAYRGALRERLSASLSSRRIVTRTRIRLAKGHADLDGLRLAFLSDVHAGNYLDEADFLAVCERVTREAPDAVCFGGDLINIDEDETLELRKGLSLLEPPASKRRS